MDQDEQHKGGHQESVTSHDPQEVDSCRSTGVKMPCSSSSTDTCQPDGPARMVRLPSLADVLEPELLALDLSAFAARSQSPHDSNDFNMTSSSITSDPAKTPPPPPPPSRVLGGLLDAIQGSFPRRQFYAYPRYSRSEEDIVPGVNTSSSKISMSTAHVVNLQDHRHSPAHSPGSSATVVRTDHHNHLHPSESSRLVLPTNSATPVSGGSRGCTASIIV